MREEGRGDRARLSVLRLWPQDRKRDLAQTTLGVDGKVGRDARRQQLLDERAVRVEQTRDQRLPRPRAAIRPAVVKREAVMDAEIARLELERNDAIDPRGCLVTERIRDARLAERANVADLSPFVTAVDYFEATVLDRAFGEREPNARHPRRRQVARVRVVLVPRDFAADERGLYEHGVLEQLDAGATKRTSSQPRDRGVVSVTCDLRRATRYSGELEYLAGTWRWRRGERLVDRAFELLEPSTRDDVPDHDPTVRGEERVLAPFLHWTERSRPCAAAFALPAR